MRCRQARREMYELLYGVTRDRAVLEEHLGRCEACRVEFARLEQLDTAFREELRWEPEHADLERVTRAVLDTVVRAPTASRHRLVAWPRLAAALAALVAVFACGAMAGRTLLPREVVITRIVEKPKIVERTVEVPFEIIKERVVTREVPVVRTRVVYRDRLVPWYAIGPPAPAPEAEPRPVKAAEVALPVQAVSFVYSPPVTHELTPVTLAPADEPFADSSQGRDNQEPDVGPAASHVTTAVKKLTSEDRMVVLLPE